MNVGIFFNSLGSKIAESGIVTDKGGGVILDGMWVILMLSSWGTFDGGRIVRSGFLVAFVVVGGGVGDREGFEVWCDGVGAV